MTTAPEVADWTPLDALAPLLVYPTDTLPAHAAAAGLRLAASAPPLADRLAETLDALASWPAHELEELYTQTFDLNPVCTLEVGWHLYGEQYERGRFLVRCRDLLHEAGVDEAGELPDFLPSLLLAVARLEQERALDVASYLLPAVRTMCRAMKDKSLEGRAALYVPVLDAVREVLEARVPQELVDEAESRFRPNRGEGMARGIEPGPNGVFPMVASGGLTPLGVNQAPRSGAVHGLSLSKLKGGRR